MRRSLSSSSHRAWFGLGPWFVGIGKPMAPHEVEADQDLSLFRRLLRVSLGPERGQGYGVAPGYLSQDYNLLCARREDGGERAVRSRSGTLRGPAFQPVTEDLFDAPECPFAKSFHPIAPLCWST